MPHGNVAIAVATGLLGLALHQFGNRFTLVQIRIDYLDETAASWRRRFDFN
jgi:hypothetical protein